ncbi:MAG: hypothetical protein Q8K12_06295 [Thiobacillus sp.]|nr:hypothetical protein [Thiobacillus sp.]
MKWRVWAANLNDITVFPAATLSSADVQQQSSRHRLRPIYAARETENRGNGALQRPFLLDNAFRIDQDTDRQLAAAFIASAVFGNQAERMETKNRDMMSGLDHLGIV